MTSSSSVELSSHNKCDNGPPSLGITLELELVMTACPIPEPWRAIRREEPSVLFISMPVLILELSPDIDCRDSEYTCDCRLNVCGD